MTGVAYNDLPARPPAAISLDENRRPAVVAYLKSLPEDKSSSEAK